MTEEEEREWIARSDEDEQVGDVDGAVEAFPSTIEKEVEAGRVREVRTPFIFAMQYQQATMRGSPCLMFRLFLPPHSVVHCAFTSIVLFLFNV